ncbi:MAG: protein phosphatase 2C domain-containing protein [Acidobacteriota bacterium]
MNDITSASIKVYGATDAGRLRKFNEDRFSLANIDNGCVCFEQFAGFVGEEGFLMLVSDGAGGDGRGGIASALAVQVFQEEILNSDPKQAYGKCLMDATRAANELIWEQSRRTPETAGMAATLTAAWIVPPLAYLVEVGDSRCYLVRNQTIKQLTRDQSMAQTLIDAGVLTPNSAKTHPYRNIVLQSLGARETVVPVVTTLELARGDRLLICSDGLSKKLSEAQILEIVAQSREVAVACRLLIEKAKELGAEDNITVVLGIVDGEAFSLPQAFPTLVLSEAADEAELSDELVDVTDILLPASPSREEQTPG